MSATIWTRLRASYPPGIELAPAPGNATTVFTPWPFAVDVRQIAREAPECKDIAGESVGGDLLSKEGNGECRCEYTNHGLAVGNMTERSNR